MLPVSPAAMTATLYASTKIIICIPINDMIASTVSAVTTFLPAAIPVQIITLSTNGIQNCMTPDTYLAQKKRALLTGRL